MFAQRSSCVIAQEGKFLGHRGGSSGGSSFVELRRSRTDQGNVKS